MQTALEYRWQELTLEQALGAASPHVAQVLERALAGDAASIPVDDALLLAEADGDDLLALCRAADELRRRAVGERITYVVNRNINFTNICIVGCAFCGFARGPNAADAYSLTFEQMAEKAREARQRGATEVCIQGGLPRNLDGFFYRDILRAIKRAVPEIHIHAFSPMEIDYGVEKTGMLLPEYLLMLKSEGLGSIPGTAAEILDDAVRSQLSPNKLKVARWVEIIRAAHVLGIPSTSTMMYGHVESPRHWVNHILLLRRIQRETRGFTEFVPLAFIHEKTRLWRREHSRPGPEASGREDLAVHALARVLLDGAIPNLQVSWVKMGFPKSLACLEAGANDFSGTLMEEHISKSAGATHGEYTTPEEFRAHIRRIGRIPAERGTTYRILREFPARDAHDTPAAARLRIADAPGHAAYTGSSY